MRQLMILSNCFHMIGWNVIGLKLNLPFWGLPPFGRSRVMRPFRKEGLRWKLKDTPYSTSGLRPITSYDRCRCLYSRPSSPADDSGFEEKMTFLTLRGEIDAFWCSKLFRSYLFRNAASSFCFEIAPQLLDFFVSRTPIIFGLADSVVPMMCDMLLIAVGLFFQCLCLSHRLCRAKQECA